MYQSLYRKYRPNNFKEVVGQSVVVQTLIHTIMKKKLSHAYLFTGPRGTGKTSIAKILAKTINCEFSENALPCEKCVNCTQYNNKQNSDIIEIDAASNNGVDEIRELKNKINIVPSNGKYKVYIIDEVHMLTVGAFNALLKTLEEPPSHVIFILATTEPHKIPSTILSRCQRFDFKKISVSEIKNHLKNVCEWEKIGISDEALYELARISDGGMRDALSLLDQVISYANDSITIDDIHEINGTLPQYQLKNLFENLLNNEITEIFKIIDMYDKNGKNFVKIIDEFVLFLRNVLLCLETPEYLKTMVDNYDMYEKISESVNQSKIISYIEILNSNMSEMKLSNNPRLNLEICFIKLVNSEKQNQNIPQVNEKIKSNPQEKKDSEKNNSQPKDKKNIIKKLDEKKYEKLKEIRLNNTLCNFDKKQIIKVKSQLEGLNQYILNPEFSSSASILIDGNLKAVGNNYLIFVYENSSDSYLYNENLIKIDNLLSEILNCNIHSIAFANDEWNIIKNDFNNHLKEYVYIEESPEDIKFLINDVDIKNDIESSFDDLVQYN